MGLFLESAKNEQLYMKEDTRKQNLFMQEEGGGTGKDGKSAYEIWLEQGNEGTEEDFIESLKGKDGYTPQKGVDYFDGKDGYTPQKGIDYFDGEDGEDYILTEADKEEIAGKAAEKVEIPAEYVTETELEAKGYQTKTEAANAYQPKGSYATTEQLAETEAKIPTKVSQLGNDKNYLEAETDPTVPSWAKAASKPTYTKSEVGLGNVSNERQYSANNPPPYPVTSVNGSTGDVEVEPKGTAQTKVTNHNADDEAHNDIRLLISALIKKVNDLLDSDDTTLDQMSEVVAYIKANRELLESYTTEKVNVADIIDNLTTSVSNKPLSAKQGVQIKALIDAIKVPTALSQLSGDSTHRTVTDAEKTAWNNKSNFDGDYNSLTNKPTKVTNFTNDAGYQTAAQVQNYAQPKGNYITEADFAKLNILNPDNFEGTDSEKLQACFDTLVETGGVISINRNYTLTDNIKIRHDSGGSHQIFVVGTGKVAGIDFGNYSFVTYDPTDTTKYGGLVFEHLRLTGEGIGFDFTHLIRITFNACIIRRFTHFVYADDYIQTLCINDCLIRYSLGATVKTSDSNAEAQCYDVKIRGCTAEFGVSLFEAHNVYGCSIIQNCIESYTSAPIVLKGYLGMLDISSNYFEKNGDGVSVDFSGIPAVSTANVSNNMFIENEENRKGSILLPKQMTRSLIISGNYGTIIAEVPSDAKDLTGVYYFGNTGGFNDTGKKLQVILPSDIISMLGSAVVSVNGKKGEVVLNADDVGAASKSYVDNSITNLNAQGIQQTFCMAQGNTLEECLAWLEANGDKTKAYIMNGNVSDEIYGYFRYEITIEPENEIPKSTDVDRTTIFNKKGYQLSLRINSSGVVTSSSAPAVMGVTGFIPAKAGDVIEVTNYVINDGYTSYMAAYNAANTPTGKLALNLSNIPSISSCEFSITLDEATFGSNFDAIRISGNLTDATSVINKSSGGVISEYRWESTGHKFVK